MQHVVAANKLKSILLPHVALEEGKSDDMIMHIFGLMKSIGGSGMRT